MFLPRSQLFLALSSDLTGFPWPQLSILPQRQPPIYSLYFHFYLFMFPHVYLVIVLSGHCQDQFFFFFFLNVEGYWWTICMAFDLAPVSVLGV